MKTITENATKLSKYLFEDSKSVSMESEKIIVGERVLYRAVASMCTTTTAIVKFK